MWAFWIFLGLALLDMEYQNMICSIFCSVGLKGYSVLNFKKTLNISYFEVYSNNVGSKILCTKKGSCYNIQMEI